MDIEPLSSRRSEFGAVLAFSIKLVHPSDCGHRSSADDCGRKRRCKMVDERPELPAEGHAES